MKTRSANEWRDFWRDRGERELGAHELGLPADVRRDEAVADRVFDWFETS